jgi:hypothetical protein
MAWGYIDIEFLLPGALFANFFLVFYHFSIARIRQQSLTSIGFLGKEGEKEAARQLYLL